MKVRAKRLIYLLILIHCGKHLYGQNLQWVFALESERESVIKTVTTDSYGNIIVGGYANRSVDFDPKIGVEIPPSLSYQDSFFAKYDRLGNYLWAFRISSINDEIGVNEILVDEDDNILVFGNVGGPTDFDPTSAEYKRGSFDVDRAPFIAKYSSEGILIWAEVIGETGFSSFSDAEIDNNGDIVITGIMGLELDFDPSSSKFVLTNPTSRPSVFLAKYSSEGTLIWAKASESPERSLVSDIAILPNNNILITGKEEGTDLDFGPGIFNFSAEYYTNVSNYAVLYISEFTQNGDFVRATGFKNPEPGNEESGILKIDSEGNLILFYDVYLRTYLDGYTDELVGRGGSDAVLMKLDQSGSLIWYSHLGGKQEDKIQGLAINSNDEILITGIRTQDLIVTESEAIRDTIYNYNGGYDSYVVKYSPNGKIMYSGAYESLPSGAGSARIEDVIFDTDTSFLLVGGSYDFDADLNQGVQPVIVGMGKKSAFIARYSNAPPSINITQEELMVCSLEEFHFDIDLSDDNYDGLAISLNSSNQSVLIDENASITRSSSGYVLDIIRFESFGETEVTISVTDEFGKIDVATVNLKVLDNLPVPQILGINSTDIDICSGSSYELESSVDSNILWSTGETTTKITVFTSGEYWVKSVNQSGCESINSDTVTINFAPPPIQPTVTVTGPIEFCEGGRVELTSDLSDNIIWSTGETSQTISVSQSGIYTVWQKSEICEDGIPSREIEVIVNPIPEQPIIEVMGATQFCEGGSVNLSTTATGNISWSNGSTNPTLEVTESGMYTLYVENNGCISQMSDPINIKVDENFSFKMISDTVVCEGIEQLEIMPELESNNIDYLWSDGSSLPSLIVDSAGIYWLEVSNGTCEKPRVYIEVTEACYPKIFLPNAFSPNGDGVNDTFEIMGSRVLLFELSIFNRWGNQVYHTKALDSFWDGTVSGKPVSSGTYSYNVVYSGEINGQILQFTQTGTVALIR
tara:strand:- start:51106 stop:54042 length:2937 start_codon:yes stop_codon:yes gene_type:complete